MGHPKETRPRKWHKPVPCPTCGSRNISFDRIAWAVNRKTSAIRQIWACSCERHGILILTRHDDLKEAIRAATRDGNTPFVGYAQTRHNAFLYARDEIRKALAAAVDERGAGNPFLPQRDELVTQDMHTCDLCGRWCSSPVYSIGLIYGGQAKTFTEVCADCMWRLKFSPVRTISLDAYRLFEQWRLSQSEADE